MAARLITVIGVGNVLAHDEGVGPKVIERLSAEGVPKGVRLVDLGSGGMSLLDYLQDARSVVLVDCALMDLKPGSIRTFRPGQVKSRRTGQAGYSLHSGDLLGLIELATKLFRCPPIQIVAVQPEDLSSGLGLSPTLTHKLPRLVSTVRRFLPPCR